MKTAALLAASACSCLAAIGNFRMLGTTTTHALLAYPAPDGSLRLTNMALRLKGTAYALR